MRENIATSRTHTLLATCVTAIQDGIMLTILDPDSSVGVILPIHTVGKEVNLRVRKRSLLG